MLSIDLVCPKWRRIVPSAPNAVFGSNLTLWLESTRGITVTGSGVSAWVDQSGNGHDASQGTDANRPPYANQLVDFTGTPRFMAVAAGSGWPAHSSHSFFSLVRSDRTNANDALFDTQTGRIAIYKSLSTGGPDTLGYFDGTLRTFGASIGQLGWQILEYHLDADAALGRCFVNGVEKGSAQVYTAHAIGGAAVNLGADFSGSQNMDGALGAVIIVSRATGHAAGVTTADERIAVRRYLQYFARRLGVAV